ncbi:hypothetical protein B0H13DRAFT_2675394 [Mycena leptocephala]|nr:hypothetical protein B0H13DRAFT_2675394 [Mycena leptocephala]
MIPLSRALLRGIFHLPQIPRLRRNHPRVAHLGYYCTGRVSSVRRPPSFMLLFHSLAFDIGAVLIVSWADDVLWYVHLQ